MFISKKWLANLMLCFLMLLYFIFMMTNVPTLLQLDYLSNWTFVKSICVTGGESLFDHNSIRSFEWGAWLMSFISCKLAGASPVVLMLSSLFFASFSIYLFMQIVLINFGIKSAILFFIGWTLSPDIISSSYNNTATMSGMFWLSFIIYFIHKLISSKSDKASHFYMFAIAATLFIIYSTSFIYILIVPGVILVCTLINKKYLFGMLLIILGCYVIESLTISFISNGDIFFGRLGKFFDVNHVNNLFSTFPKSGLFKLWYQSTGNVFVLYLITFFLSIVSISSYKEKHLNVCQNHKFFIYLLSIIYISFFILATLFLILFDTSKVADSFSSTSLSLVMPLCLIIGIYYLIIFYTSLQGLFLRLSLFLAMLVILMPNTQYLFEKKYKGDSYISIATIFDVNNHYRNIDNKHCIKSESKKSIIESKYIYQNWHASGYDRLNRESEMFVEFNKTRLYIPDRCHDPFLLY